MKGYLLKDKNGFMVGTKCSLDSAIVLAFFENREDAEKELKHAHKGTQIIEAECVAL